MQTSERRNHGSKHIEVIMNNIAFFTYTHSNCKDVWIPYFNKLDKHAGKIKSYVMSDLFSNDFERHKFLVYNDDLPYCQEYVRCLEQVEEEYVIYMQEDFILYADVDMELVERYTNYLKEDKSISYVRLLRCGDLTNKPYQTNLCYVSPDGRSNNSINSYSMQPTIWRKSDLIELYNVVKRSRFGECFEYTQGMNKLNLNGVYHYSGESPRGGHFDSNIFPYIATAIVKGKWNVSEYPSELKRLFREFHINYQQRGIC